MIIDISKNGAKYPAAFIILKKQMRTSGLNNAISTIPEREKEIKRNRFNHLINDPIMS